MEISILQNNSRFLSKAESIVFVCISKHLTIPTAGETVTTLSAKVVFLRMHHKTVFKFAELELTNQPPNHVQSNQNKIAFIILSGVTKI